MTQPTDPLRSALERKDRYWDFRVTFGGPDVDEDRMRWYIDHALRAYQRTFKALDSDPLRRMGSVNFHITSYKRAAEPVPGGAVERRPALPIEAEHLPGCEHPCAPAWICECPRPIFATTESANRETGELREFASLMVDEVIATTRAQLESGVGLSLADQRHLLDQLIKDRERLATAHPGAQGGGACEHDWRYIGTDPRGSHKGEDMHRCVKCRALEYRS